MPWVIKASRWRRGRRGVSLIIVLASLVLLTILILAFLAGIGTELQSSKVYANGSSVRLLAQSAVALVMGQIQTATADQTLCWASQPGMIRTYDNSGKPAGYYKLYSDDSMQGTGAFDHTQTANVVSAQWSTQWYNQKGVYVDLNQPVTVNGANLYPILDGNSSDYSTSYVSPLASLTLPKPASATINSLAPPSGVSFANGLPAVTGFWLNNNTPVDPTAADCAPMPVKWLYVLQKGEVIVPDSNPSNGVVTFKNAGVMPSSSDPIVGRMAYWTDDETCKVNVNTASEGTFWDTPRTWSTQDVALATNQPAQNEFQRYPGHPAMVSLSAVFNGFTAEPASSFPEDLYPITPRVIAGGSKEGTVLPTAALTLRATRLYASPAEFLFQPNLASGAPGSGTRALNDSLLTSTTELDQTAMEKADFFLTASSEAPDVNLFNLPRVSLWPITLNLTTGAPATTAYDKLIAFCSTINNAPFYFERQNADSPTVDLPTIGAATGLGRNRQLLEYLRTLTSQNIPGFGGSFAAKYGTPGDRDQILTEIFDYIRCTNLLDSTTGATAYAPQLDSNAAITNNTYQGGAGQVVPIIDQNIQGLPNAGSTSDHPRGFGRFPTLQQPFFVFIGAGDNKTNPAATTVSGIHYAPVAVGMQRVQPGFFVQMFNPSVGEPLVHPWYQIQVTGLDSLKWSNNGGTFYNMGFPSGTIILPQPYARGDAAGEAGGGAGAPAFYGGMDDFRLETFTVNGSGSGVSAYPAVGKYTGGVLQAAPYTTPDPASCPDMTTGGTFNFQGGPVVISIYALNASKGNPTLLQTINLNFPAGTFPVPTTIDNPTYTDGPPLSLTTFPIGSRLNWYMGSPWITSYDTVRALLPAMSSNVQGDVRMILPRTTVSASYFSPMTSPAANAYSNPAAQFSHMLRFGERIPVYGAAGGQLVYTSTASYDNYLTAYPKNDYNAADFSSGYTGTRTSFYTAMDNDVQNQGSTLTLGSGLPPDWDNGVGNVRDGAYINKADEGDTGTLSGTAGHGMPYYDLDFAPYPTPPSSTLFSPNRMMPSAGMFGSLPSGVWSGKPWQTLLFRPGPAGHPGLGTPLNPPASGIPPAPPYSASAPPDHLLLDLFNMPVVEPYAISTPLATAGRINMNYLIVPFTYINRDTGLRAAMKSQQVTAIANGFINVYKSHGNVGYGGTPPSTTTRFPINLDSTLSQFLARFFPTNGTPDIFHSASEICNIDLVPTVAGAPSIPITRTNMDGFWTKYELTGDNTRERPYANLYPLLTTKSNTFTVHYRVQTLKQTWPPGANASSWQSWREGVDVVSSEYRGSQTIERYVDPNDTIPDYASPSVTSSSQFPPAQPLSKYYKFRIVSTKQFPP